MAPNFRRADFDSGVTAAIQAIVAGIGGEYKGDDTSDITELTPTVRILIGLGIYAVLSIFAFFALIIDDEWGWYAYLFLIPFFAIFPALVLPSHLWYVPGLSFIIIFPIIKWVTLRTSLGKKMNAAMFGSGTGSGSSSGDSSSSSSSWSSGSSSSSGSSFSGGGGSFGGGGSSGGW
jgi:uncharacterized protein